MSIWLNLLLFYASLILSCKKKKKNFKKSGVKHTAQGPKPARWGLQFGPLDEFWLYLIYGL